MARGAREKHKWLRDELVDTVVQFLDASFASPGNALLHKRRESRLTAQDHEEALGVHRSALTALTRLRVLASEDVVKCAEKLHLADNDAYKMVFVVPICLTSGTGILTGPNDNSYWRRC